MECSRMVDSIANAIVNLGEKSCVLSDDMSNLILPLINNSLLCSDDEKRIELVKWCLSAFVGNLYEELLAMEDEPSGRKDLYLAWITVFLNKRRAICEDETIDNTVVILQRTDEQKSYVDEYLDRPSAYAIFGEFFD